MSSFKKTLSLLAVLLLPAFGFSQEIDTASNPPQILTTDLIRAQMLIDPVKVVSFIIVDDDDIQSVTINDVPQKIEPGKTVVINKKFLFKPGKTLVTIIATDTQGNQRKRSFLVGLGEDVEIAADEGKEEKFLFKVSLGLKLETDDNPTNDLSSPIDLGDITVEGVVPDDQQTDSRATISATVSGGIGSVTGIAGVVKTKYGTASNDFLGSQAIFLGVIYNTSISAGTNFMFNYLLTDINVGGNDFAQSHAITPSFLFSSKDEEGFYKHAWSLNYTQSMYASADKTDGPSNMLKYDYGSLDAERFDDYKMVIAVGSASGGTEKSEVSFVNFDFDWMNQWESGFKWDLGFGIQKRDYKNDVPMTSDTALGSTRVDLPIRFSTGMGWQFNKDWKAMYDYRYVFNLSNKVPYVRTISGLAINGSF